MATQLTVRKIAKATDEQLSEMLANATTDRQVDLIVAEIDRRQAIDDRINELVDQGWEFRDAYAEAHGLDPEELARQERAALVQENRQPGESLEQTVDRMYGEETRRAYERAEGACCGVLLNEAGRKAGVDPYTLFHGPAARVRRYASEELRDWFAANGRLTWIEYMAYMLGRPSDIRKAALVDKDLGETRAA